MDLRFYDLLRVPVKALWFEHQRPLVILLTETSVSGWSYLHLWSVSQLCSVLARTPNA
jgi:hypothetical protein